MIISPDKEDIVSEILRNLERLDRLLRALRRQVGAGAAAEGEKPAPEPHEQPDCP